VYADAGRLANGVPYKGSAVPKSALRLVSPDGKTPAAADGALWAWGPTSGQGAGSCYCHQVRSAMDGWGRIWAPSMPTFSIMVIDTNGNRVMRLGRYGNVDDTAKDVKEGRDGLRFGCPRAIAVSDRAVYVRDPLNRRILKAKFEYQATEEVSCR
jgi:hypothetical protein